MKKDGIAVIGIDGQDRLYVVPETRKFPYIYRTAMGVHWNSDLSCLYAPSPGKWTCLDWFRQIISAAAEQSCQLELTDSTRWENIPEKLKNDIQELMQSIDHE